MRQHQTQCKCGFHGIDYSVVRTVLYNHISICYVNYLHSKLRFGLDLRTWNAVIMGSGSPLQILIGGKVVAALDRNKAVKVSLPPLDELPPQAGTGPLALDILVEGLGRDNGGSKFDLKGLMSQHVYLNGALRTLDYDDCTLTEQRKLCCESATTFRCSALHTNEGVINQVLKIAAELYAAAGVQWLKLLGFRNLQQ